MDPRLSPQGSPQGSHPASQRNRQTILHHSRVWTRQGSQRASQRSQQIILHHNRRRVLRASQQTALHHNRRHGHRARQQEGQVRSRVLNLPARRHEVRRLVPQCSRLSCLHHSHQRNPLGSQVRVQALNLPCDHLPSRLPCLPRYPRHSRRRAPVHSLRQYPPASQQRSRLQDLLVSRPSDHHPCPLLVLRQYRQLSLPVSPPVARLVNHLPFRLGSHLLRRRPSRVGNQRGSHQHSLRYSRRVGPQQFQVLSRHPDLAASLRQDRHHSHPGVPLRSRLLSHPADHQHSPPEDHHQNRQLSPRLTPAGNLPRDLLGLPRFFRLGFRLLSLLHGQLDNLQNDQPLNQAADRRLSQPAGRPSNQLADPLRSQVVNHHRSLLAYHQCSPVVVRRHSHPVSQVRFHHRSQVLGRHRNRQADLLISRRHSHLVGHPRSHRVGQLDNPVCNPRDDHHHNLHRYRRHSLRAPRHLNRAINQVASPHPSPLCYRLDNQPASPAFSQLRHHHPSRQDNPL
jgi:hypothetical protein